MAGASIEQLMFLVRSTLMADADVAALVDNRIHGGHLENPDATTAQYPLVVLDFRSGKALTSGYQSVLMELMAYSRNNYGEALRVYDACQAVLQQGLLRRDGVGVAGYAMEEFRPLEGFNPDIRAYFVEGQFTIRAGIRS